jgi:hypothetical protein
MRKRLKRPIVVSIGVASALSISGIAFAYWTGTGSGTVGANLSSGSTVTLTGVIADGLAPGVDETVTIKATPSTTEKVTIGTVTLSSVTVDVPHAACDVSWFTMSDVVANEETPAGGALYTLTHTGTLQMTDTATNQNACKGATITLHLSSS